MTVQLWRPAFPARVDRPGEPRHLTSYAHGELHAFGRWAFRTLRGSGTGFRYALNGLYTGSRCEVVGWVRAFVFPFTVKSTRLKAGTGSRR